jgi:hypothetical protein
VGDGDAVVVVLVAGRLVTRTTDFAFGFQAFDQVSRAQITRSSLRVELLRPFVTLLLRPGQVRVMNLPP